MRTNRHTNQYKSLTLATLAGIALSASSASAASAFYTDSGFGTMNTANANNWGSSNKTTSSVMFETFIDFTTAVDDATDPFSLFELGADGIGSGIAIDGDDIIFAAGGGSVANTAQATGLHGLTAGDYNVQILGVLEFGAGTGTNELLTLYVNGTLVATADNATGNDWAGANNSTLGGSDSFSIFEYTTLNPTPDDGSNGIYAGDYPDQTTTITFASYELGVDGNTVANIAVPEPGSVALLGLGSIMFLRRRSRA